MAALPLLDNLAPQSAALQQQQQTRLSPNWVTQLVADYRAGTDMNALARTYGIDPHRVRAHLSKASLEVRRNGLTEVQLGEAARPYMVGLSLAKLGEHFGCDHTTFGRALRRRGIPIRKP